MSHECGNCLGIDPNSCYFNPDRVQMGQVRICELPHETIEEEEACEALMLAGIPECKNCVPQNIESHPVREVVRCANCKAILA